ncbi:MAG: hypothetical protein NWE96_05675 [Candidatus Bathyarchaeota archaeon]|nr:hypothetical protein [Candidatus Bathyarchaeota archaeon]
MTKKALMLILILLVPLLSTPAISAAQTQNVLICQGKVKLFSPYNRTYTPTESLHLDAALDIRYGPSNVYAANYTIDDGPLIKVSKDNIRDEFWSVSYGGIYVDVDLPKLPIGQHKLTIYISSDYPNGTPPYVVSGEATVYFTVSTTKTQDTPTTGGEINIYSPCNISYSPKSVIPIEASASTMGQNLTYTATYCVDGQGLYILRTKSFQTYQYDLFFGSMTATGELYFLPEGQHNVTVYMRACRANSEIPTITSEATVYFRVGDTKPPKHHPVRDRWRGV